MPRARHGDGLYRALLWGLGGLVPLLFLAVLGRLVAAALPALERFGLRFVVGRVWDPVAGQFGGLPFLVGTVASSILALLLAVPLALGLALFLTDLAPRWLAVPVAFCAELLAAVPSVVYGLWGLFVLVPWLREHVQAPLAASLGATVPLLRGPAYGVSLFSAGVLLAIMIVPYIAAVAREVLAAVPAAQREASLALGATRWETLARVVLPYALPGLFGAVMLGLGRALGETMAVTMVIGNRPDVPTSLFQPAYTLASVLANEFAEATDDLHLAALMEIGLLLLLVTLGVNILARLLVWRVAQRWRTG